MKGTAIRKNTVHEGPQMCPDRFSPTIYYLVLGININLEQRADNSSTYILPGTGYEATKQKPYVKKGKKNDPPNRGRREQTKRKTNRNAKKGFQPLRTYTVKEPCNTYDTYVTNSESWE